MPPYATIPNVALEYLHSLPAPQYTPTLPDGPSTPPENPYTPSFLSVTLQWTIFTSMYSLQYTICSCQEYICSTVKLSQFLQYLPRHALLSSSCFTILKDQQSGLDMEIWLTPVRTSTCERPFTWEGNYVVASILGEVYLHIGHLRSHLCDNLGVFLVCPLSQKFCHIYGTDRYCSCSLLLTYGLVVVIIHCLSTVWM